MSARRFFAFLVSVSLGLMINSMTYGSDTKTPLFYTFDDYKGDMWHTIQQEPCLKELVAKKDVERAELVYLFHKAHFWEYPLASFCDPKNSSHVKSLSAIWEMADEYTYHIIRDNKSDDNENEEPKGLIGVTMMKDRATSNIVVTYVVPNGPADNADIRQADIIEAIDDMSTKNISEARVRLLGKLNSEVLVIVRRGNEYYKKTMWRSKVHFSNISVESFGNIGYIGLYSFQLNSSERKYLKTQLALFESRHVNGIILDLRGNPGGYIEQATRLLCSFLPEKNLFLMKNLINPSPEPQTCGAYNDSPRVSQSIPLVVMTNANTCSASEIVAGSLKFYKRALLVGKKTDGKSVWQTEIYLHDDSILHITQGAWLLPDGTWTNYWGIEPHMSFAQQGDIDSEILSMPMDRRYKVDEDFLRTLTRIKRYGHFQQ